MAGQPPSDCKCMIRLRSPTTAANGGVSLRGFFLGQALAVLAAVAALALHLLLGPMFAHSVYLFCLPAVLVCAAVGGFPSAMSATAIMTVGAFLADSAAALPPSEQFGRAAVFLLVGAIVALAGGQARRVIAAQGRRLAELEERTAVQRAGLEASDEATMVIDEEGLVTGFSPAAEARFAWPAEEIIGRNAAVLMSEGEAQRHDGYIRRFVETGERRVMGSSRMVTGRRRDGAAFPMELRLGETRIGRRR